MFEGLHDALVKGLFTQSLLRSYIEGQICLAELDLEL